MGREVDHTLLKGTNIRLVEHRDAVVEDVLWKLTLDVVVVG